MGLRCGQLAARLCNGNLPATLDDFDKAILGVAVETCYFGTSPEDAHLIKAVSTCGRTVAAKVSQLIGRAVVLPCHEIA